MQFSKLTNIDMVEACPSQKYTLVAMNYCLGQNWLSSSKPMRHHKSTSYFYGDKTMLYPF